MTVLIGSADAYLNGAILTCVFPIALLIALVFWYVRTAGNLPWQRDAAKKNGGHNDTSDSSGSAAGGV